MPDSGNPLQSVDEAEMIRRAQALGPTLKQRRPQALHNRRLSDATITDLVAGGFFKILQPKRLGGLELPYGSQVAISAALAEYCGASSWLCTVVATHHWMLGKFEPAAQDDVWGKNPDIIACSAFGFSDANVTPVDGGYKVSGRWIYASGSHAAQWAIISIPVEAANGHDRMFALVPRADFEVLDNWRSVALRASGSNDIVVKDAFIPTYRTMPRDVIDRVNSPGTAVNTGTTYSLPTFGVFNLTPIGTALGLARSTLRYFTDSMKQRRNVMGAKLHELQNMQMRVSHASAEIDAAHVIAANHVRFLQATAEKRGTIDRETILRLQRDCAYIGHICQNAVARLVDVLGAGGLNEENEAQINQADLKGVCSHITMGWDANSVPYGKYLLGVEHKGLI
jgi:3-hydroxy-9,10-secoandrosta-1,3,5(10)-triene-9,17-dione monooxygenase